MTLWGRCCDQDMGQTVLYLCTVNLRIGTAICDTIKSKLALYSGDSSEHFLYLLDSRLEVCMEFQQIGENALGIPD